MNNIENITSKISDKHLPLIAILRGVTPDLVLKVAETLIDSGFTMIEVPLNSPQALKSIRLLIEEFGTENFKIGAGTVTNEKLAHSVISEGGNLVVTPNCNLDVIRVSSDAGCSVYPGVVTPTEAFNAIESGASGLKLFPASVVGVQGMAAMKSVLPVSTELYPVGGIEPTSASMSPFLEYGAKGFGLGSALYKPSMSIGEIRKKSRLFAQVFYNIKAELDR